MWPTPCQAVSIEVYSNNPLSALDSGFITPECLKLKINLQINAFAAPTNYTAVAQRDVLFILGTQHRRSNRTKEEEALRMLMNKMNNPLQGCLEMKMIASSNSLPHYCNYRCYITPWIEHSLQIKGRIWACCRNAHFSVLTTYLKRLNLCQDAAKKKSCFNLSSWWLWVFRGRLAIYPTIRYFPCPPIFLFISLS